jgi:Flp pilus assembly protein TadD
MFILKELARVDLRLGSDDLKGEADRSSDEALRRFKREPSMLDTRGAVLLWLGRRDEARGLLSRAFALASSKRTRASAACSLAIAEARDRRLGNAEQWLARARKNDPASELLGGADREVSELRLAFVARAA